MPYKDITPTLDTCPACGSENIDDVQAHHKAPTHTHTIDCRDCGHIHNLLAKTKAVGFKNK